jgi:hypothetical protein
MATGKETLLDLCESNAVLVLVLVSVLVLW